MARKCDNWLDRFWGKVRKGSEDDCWPWTGSLDWGLYGQFKFMGKMVKAHRLSYAITSNKSINELKVICHSCDNRKCVNPKHLIEANQSYNMKDAFIKGRIRRDGKNNPSKTLTSEQLERIISLYKELKSIRLVAWRLRISKSNVHNVVSGKHWMVRNG